jgi:hypothetical protein
VRTIYIYALLARVVRIFKHVRLTIGDMFPEREIGVTYGGQL